MPCKDLTQSDSPGLSHPHPHPCCTSPDLGTLLLASVEEHTLDTPVPCVSNGPMGGGQE